MYYPNEAQGDKVHVSWGRKGSKEWVKHAYLAREKGHELYPECGDEIYSECDFDI